MEGGGRCGGVDSARPAPSGASRASCALFLQPGALPVVRAPRPRPFPGSGRQRLSGERWLPATDRSAVVGAGHRPGQPGPAPTTGVLYSLGSSAPHSVGPGELAQVGSGVSPGSVCPDACAKPLCRPPTLPTSLGAVWRVAGPPSGLPDRRRACRGTGRPSGLRRPRASGQRLVSIPCLQREL